MPLDFRQPMRSVPSSPRHSRRRRFSTAWSCRANQTPEQDLKQALDAIFNHPNVGPFIGRQLIQRLVTSNPSPATFIASRRSFNNNGRGVRGDLGAVIRAILTDYEARADDAQSRGCRSCARAGHPLNELCCVRSAPRHRAERSSSGNPGPLRSGADAFAHRIQLLLARLSGARCDCGQRLEQPGVSNHDRDDRSHEREFLPPGDLRTRSVRRRIAISLDLTKEQEPRRKIPRKLVDHLDLLLMSSSMSPEMRTDSDQRHREDPGDDRVARARTAIYLVINSPEFVVEK
ncbi:MAG: DUF1800 family protein [Geodermatophilaceae bacterium]